MVKTVQTKLLKIENFAFEISLDLTADAVSALEIMVYFMDEPCCDDSGHQYRLYLPAGVQDSSVRDLCDAFTKAVHCEQHALLVA